MIKFKKNKILFSIIFGISFALIILAFGQGLSLLSIVDFLLIIIGLSLFFYFILKVVEKKRTNGKFINKTFLISIILGIFSALISSFLRPGLYLIFGFWIKIVAWTLLFYVILKLFEYNKNTGKILNKEWLANHRHKASLIASFLLVYFTIIPSPRGILHTVEGPAPCVWQFPIWSYCLDLFGGGTKIIYFSFANFIFFYLISFLIINSIKRNLKNS